MSFTSILVVPKTEFLIKSLSEQNFKKHFRMNVQNVGFKALNFVIMLNKHKSNYENNGINKINKINMMNQGFPNISMAPY